ncbi:MAG TPA: NFACT RNA binding domain-containing protein, partial [Candidatus Tumulicola sp.]|nr:NFACT RNA binding domain-containing protein [Candidatus Tumulicola sp.]
RRIESRQRHDVRLPQPSVRAVRIQRFAHRCVRKRLLEQRRRGIAGRRRRAALVRLDERERKLRDELAALDAKRRQAGERDGLRAEGEALFAGLHALDEPARDEAKERAAKLFARYKKLGASLPHVERRERETRSKLAAIEELRWEAERVADGELNDVEEALASVDPRPSRKSALPVRRRKRAPLQFVTAEGSRIWVGRSPLENAELTFKHARPNDLWFHARGTPGAHVILARDDRSTASQADVEAAAALAAFYSKARAGAKVAVDYTARKHVRKQRDAAPGLVWYTDAQTVTVAPNGDVPSAPPSG